MGLARQFRLLFAAALLAALAACGSTSKAPASGEYRVVRGDTLAKIARQHGQSVSELMRLNNLSNPNRIEVGQLLRVSGQASASAGGGSGTAGPARSAPPAVSGPTGPVPARRIALAWPAEGKVTRGFDGSTSRGIVIANRLGAPVTAAAAGTVAYAGDGLRGYGNMVILRHDADYLSVYANNRSLRVKQGQKVARGQRVAEMGEVAASSPGLYFEVRYKGNPVDPRRLLPSR